MVSVIVPVYNAANVISRCVDSIINQTYKDIEVILVNDGSTDKTYQILEKYRYRDSRVCLVSQRNKGVAAARNTGLEYCKGEYFLFVDADDWIEKDMIQKMISLVDEDTDIVFCNSDHAESPDEVIKRICSKNEVWDRKQQQLEFMKHQRMTGMLWNKLIRRDLSERIFFNEKTGYGEDAEFLWKILQKSKKMIVTDEVLYHHVLNANSISHQTFNDKKYSAIPMWKQIVEDVCIRYPDLSSLAIERLMCATVYSLYEIKKSKYNNEIQIKNMKNITRRYIGDFVKSKNISMKFKIFAVIMCI
ncbi:glycosyltransferase [Blautia schinkii]|nr:glycosyltransferase [Blautia schinkii]